MKEIGEWKIPFRSLTSGASVFAFPLDANFFRQFEASLIRDGNIDVSIEVVKGLQDGKLTLAHAGRVSTTCDRCLKPLDLPVEGQVILTIKESNGESGDGDWLTVDDTDGTIDLKKVIYDYVSLSFPMVKYCQQDPPCHSEVLERLQAKSEQSNPAWDELNKLNL